jgi:hypothetical protein
MVETARSRAEARPPATFRQTNMDRITGNARSLEDRADAVGAAINYLRAVGVTERTYPTRIRKDGRLIVTTWDRVLRETAEAIAEEGLIHAYAGLEHRSTRKRRAYREAEARRAQQSRRSEGAVFGTLAALSTKSKIDLRESVGAAS